MPIKALIWDFAGVLLHTIRGDFYSMMAERLQTPLDDVLQATNGREAVLWDIGEMSDEEFFTYLLKKVGMPLDKMPILQRFVRYDFFVEPELLAYICLMHKKYKSILLTNFPAHIHDYIKTDWIIDGAFDHIIASCDVKLLKPDAAMYRYALMLAGVPAQETIFIDDRPVNIQGAEQLGMPCVLFTSVAQTIRDVDAILKAEA